MSVRADLALLGLAVVGVLSELACVLTGHTPPGLFQEVTLAGVAGAAGVALPAGRPAAAGDQVPAVNEAAPAPLPQPTPVTPQ